MESENPTTRRAALQEGLAMRWLIHTQNVPKMVAAGLLLDGKSRVADEALLVANFVLCVLDDRENRKPLV